MFPAEHRALRELHAMTRQLAGHWAKLGDRLGGDPGALLDEGANAARVLLDELEERVGELARPARGPVRRRAAWPARAALSDLLLERNQAFRSALLDLQHVTTLLAYTAELARTRGDRGARRVAGRMVRAAARARGARAGRRGRARDRPGGRDRARG